MSKLHKIIYWIATVWLALGMASSGVVQMLGMEEEVERMAHLGIPLYLVRIIAIWKFLGVVAILAPRLKLLKEWAYAGFFFAMSGAAVAHVVMGDAIEETLPPILLLVLTIVSWYFRPLDRRLVAASNRIAHESAS